jgi:Bacterial Ig-like domain (group 3)
MRITRPRIGVAIVSAAVAAIGTTGTMFAAQAHAQAPTCYSTCPPKVTLHETFHVLHPGSEEIEDFFVTVRSSSIGGSPPTGTVTVETTTGTVLCTIILVHGRGSCRPGPDALPDGHYRVVAHYNGDSSNSPATSRPVQLEINSGRGGRGGFPGFPGFPGLGGAGFNLLSFLEELFGGGAQMSFGTVQTSSFTGGPHGGF